MVGSSLIFQERCCTLPWISVLLRPLWEPEGGSVLERALEGVGGEVIVGVVEEGVC